MLLNNKDINKGLLIENLHVTYQCRAFTFQE
jgi:hypothetical protein